MSDIEIQSIVFDVETSRILEILSSEIYDSPYALLRENLQNGYDAILMRQVLDDGFKDGAIQVVMDAGQIRIEDNGIGMTEDVLRNNFWRAGSSGKRNETAQRAGVVGTFGIGAMANFGVCKSLEVTTRALGGDRTLITRAERDKLSIARECIELRPAVEQREVGTTVRVDLDEASQLNVDRAKSYLQPYIQFLPIPITLNGELVTQKSATSALNVRGEPQSLGEQEVSRAGYAGKLSAKLDAAGRVIATLKECKLQGQNIVGELALIQNGGQIMGLRNWFGLAAAPVNSVFQWGGIANLSLLQPTAGREALSRESIAHISQLVAGIDDGVAVMVAKSEAAVSNSAFVQYVSNTRRFDLAKRLTIELWPERIRVELGELGERCKGKQLYQFSGRDQSILEAFSTGNAVVQVAQGNPLRKVQRGYLDAILKVPSLPDDAQVIERFDVSDLSYNEAALILRIAMTLNEDYLVADPDVYLAKISHNVEILPMMKDGRLEIALARSGKMIQPLLKVYDTAYDVFGAFVKDFVRSSIYSQIENHVPSSQRQGVDALLQAIRRKRELYRVEESEAGALEPLLGEFLAGDVSIGEVLRSARRVTRQPQRVTSGQVGHVEEELPGLVDSPSAEPPPTNNEYDAMPPILRPNLSTDMKILTTAAEYPQLNQFRVFLGLSDRLFRREGDFFHFAHTTRVIWAAHRVLYIFAHATNELTLYYEIELPEPLANHSAGGSLFRTTTLVAQNRIFVPVPAQLAETFRVTETAKEFFVRFDTIAGSS